jgi:hypothetical protein
VVALSPLSWVKNDVVMVWMEVCAVGVVMVVMRGF